MTIRPKQVKKYDQRVEIYTNATHSGSNNNGAATRAFGYNSTGEVVNSATDAATYDRYFDFDGIGNRNGSRIGTATNTGGTATSYTADAKNHYTAIGSLSPIHDADGNMTSGPLPVAPSANATLTWDAENRLTSSTVSGTTTNYQYDYLSRRISKTTTAVTTRFVYDGWNMITEYAGSALKRSYTWGMDLSGSMQGAGGVGGLLAIHEASGNGSVKAGQTLYPTFDGNGNITRIIDSSSAVVCSYAYDPFGNFENPTGNDTDSSGYDAEQPFAFSTKYRDSETGLYYYGYRYYDPVTGRWPSRDPVEEDGGFNLYGFVRNNGINHLDSLGLIIYPSKAIKYQFKVDGVRQTGRAFFNDTFDKMKCELSIDIPLAFKASYPSGTPGRFKRSDAGKLMLKDIQRQIDDGSLPAQFAQGAKEAWDDKFKLCCECDDCPDGISVKVSVKHDESGYPVYVYNHKGFTSNQDSWNINQGIKNVAAHEIGHFLGNIDEYRSVSNVRFNNRQGEYKGAEGKNFGAPNQAHGNIMNNSTGAALPIHMWYVAERSNGNTGVSKCRVVKKGESCKK